MQYYCSNKSHTYSTFTSSHQIFIHMNTIQSIYDSHHWEQYNIPLNWSVITIQYMPLTWSVIRISGIQWMAIQQFFNSLKTWHAFQDSSNASKLCTQQPYMKQIKFMQHDQEAMVDMCDWFKYQKWWIFLVTIFCSWGKHIMMWLMENVEGWDLHRCAQHCCSCKQNEHNWAHISSRCGSHRLIEISNQCRQTW